MAPEMLKNQSHDKTVDIWSLGVLLYELLHGYAPFGGISDRDKIIKITNYDFKMGEHISPDAKDLIVKLMKTNPKERIGFSEVFSHPWLKKFENSFKMDMAKFVYNPDKSRSRSRSRSPNISNIQVEKPKEPILRKEIDRRGRSNSPITSNYNTNNLLLKEEISLNSTINTNKLNNSAIKNVNISEKNVDISAEKSPKFKNDKKNNMLITSKSVENIKPFIVKNPLLTNSRETSIVRKKDDKSKSPENRTKIFENMNKYQIDAKFEENLNKSGENSNKRSYKAAKISEIDDSILKEIEKAKELEDKLGKIMKTNQEIYSQIPLKSNVIFIMNFPISSLFFRIMIITKKVC